MRRRILAVALLVVPLTLFTPSVDAQQPQFTAGIYRVPQSSLWGRACTVSTTVWGWEHGRSGVTRIKAQFDLRGPNDPGYLFYYYRKGWYYGSRFPDDSLSYYQYFTITNGTFTFPIGNRYALWAKVVGERPSFWQADLVRKGRLSNGVGCESYSLTG